LVKTQEHKNIKLVVGKDKKAFEAFLINRMTNSRNRIQVLENRNKVSINHT